VIYDVDDTEDDKDSDASDDDSDVSDKEQVGASGSGKSSNYFHSLMAGEDTE
jgi:hypothetical protein